MSETTGNPEELADQLAVEYAGALADGQVRAAVRAADLVLPEMPDFPSTRPGLLKDAARRLVVDRLVRESRAASALRCSAHERRSPQLGALAAAASG